MTVFLSVIGTFLHFLALAVFLRALLTWLPVSANNTLVVILYQITEPVLVPLRSVIPRVGMMDLSPVVAIILLELLASALTKF